MADDAGALLVRSGLVSASALDEARAWVNEHGGTLGEQLVSAGAIHDDTLTDFYRSRLLVPQVNPNSLARLPVRVVATIPSDMAIELRAIPVSLDGENNLTVAMSDPSDRHAVDEIAFFTGAYVVRAVATQMQIAWCLAHYYGHVTSLGQRLLQPSGDTMPNPQPPQEPPPAPSRAVTPHPIPRTRGLTGKVEATRHRAIAPITGPIDIVRPRSGELDLVAVASKLEPVPAVSAAKPAAAPPMTPTPAATTKSPPKGVAAAAKPAAIPAGLAPIGKISTSTTSPGVAGSKSPPVGIAATPARAKSPPKGVAASTDELAGPPTEPNIPVATDAAPTTPMQAPAAPAVDGSDRPRARSISGEIRVPIRRAPSIRPPMPDPTEPDDDEGEPHVITIEVNDADEDPTGPRKIPGPLPRRKQKPNPPELAERAGEVDTHTGPVTKVDLDEPRIIIAADEIEPPRVPDVSGEIDLGARGSRNDAVPSMSTIEITDDTGGVVIHDHLGADSEPVLLERRRRSDPPPTGDATIPTAAPRSDEDVVVLDARKAKPTPDRPLRPGKRTKVGMGAMQGRTHRDTEASGVPSMMDDAPTGSDTIPTDTDPTRVDQRPAPPRLEDTDETLAAPPSPRRDDTNPRVTAAPPKPGAPRPFASAGPATMSPRRAASEDDDGDLRGPATTVMSAVELDEAIPGRSYEVVPAHLDRKGEYDALDDGWGPPGTTIPPPLLGAIPGTDDDDDGPSPTGIPMPDVDAPPLIVAPPSPPEPARGSPQSDAGAPALVKALEDSTSRALDLLRKLERAQERDEVVKLMIAHLADTHRRAGFFAIKPDASKTNELNVFAMQPVPAVLPQSSLRLDRPSTLQDVVGTRLPYRGPMHDDASRLFLSAVLGSCPPEILLVPVAIRERVVGVLFGEHRMRHTFDDQLALAARAAGMALERILKAKRG